MRAEHACPNTQPSPLHTDAHSVLLAPCDHTLGDGVHAGWCACGMVCRCVVEANALTGVPWRRLLLADDGAEGEKNQLGRGRLSAMLPKAVPTTVIHGGATDAVVPSWDLGKTVRLVDYPRSGHLPFIDERELFLFDLLDWLDGIDKVKTPRIGLVNGNTKYGN